MKNRRIIVLCITAIVLIVTGLLYFSYGYYMTNITGTENSKKLTSLTKIFKFEFSDGTEKLVSSNTNFIPGSVIEKTFTITNKSTEGVYFNIDLDEVTNTFSRTSDIIYEVYYNNEIISTNIFPTINSSIVTNLYIEKDGTRTYTLKVKYLNSDENQISDIGKSISANIVFSRTDSPKTKFNILGNSYQEIRSGKNLIPYPYVSTTLTSNGVVWTDNKDGSVTANGTATGYSVFILVNKMDISAYHGKSLTLSLNATNNLNVVCQATMYASDGTTELYNNSSANNVTLDVPAEAKFLSLFIKRNSNNAETSGTIRPQLELASTATSYELYGVVPTPNYPSEIVSLGSKVTDNNDVNYGKYKLEFEGVGKNSINFDIANAFSGYYFDGNGSSSAADKRFIRYKAVEVKPNTTYTLSSNLGIYTIWLFDDNVSISRIMVPKSENNLIKTTTFTTPENCNYIRISLYNTSDTTDTVALEWLQLEVGSTATDYTEYAEPLKYDVYLNEPLRCIGDVCDYIDLINKKVVRNVSSETLVGNEDLNKWIYQEEQYGFYLSKSIAKKNTTMISNYFVSNSNVPKDDNSVGMGDVIYFRTQNWSEVSDVKSWIVEKNNENIPLIINYVLNTTKEESISLPDISNFKDRTLFVTDGNLNAKKVQIE